MSNFSPLIGPFMKLVGDTLANVEGKETALIDAELLAIERRRLSDHFEELQAEVAKESVRLKSQKTQELINRGLTGSTILDDNHRAIDKAAASQLEAASREYIRAVQMIGIKERDAKERSHGCMSRFFLNLARLFMRNTSASSQEALKGPNGKNRPSDSKE